MLGGVARAGPSLLGQNAVKTSGAEALPIFRQRRCISQYSPLSRKKRETKDLKRDAQGNIIMEKKEKGLGAFRPMGAASLTNPLFDPENRTSVLQLPKFAANEKLVGQVAEFSMAKDDPSRIYGLPKKMLLEFRILSKPCSVVRDITVYAADVLKQAKEKSSKETRVVITGSPGCGKSFLLFQMVENAIVNDWIVLYIPRAKKLVDSSTPYEYNLRTRTYLQPSFTLQTLRRLLDANNKKLTSLTTSKKYSFEKREVPINTTLADLINIALKEPPLAPVIMETVMSELNAQTKYPVLFAVDDFQAMYSTSAYRDPHFIPIHSYHLSLPRMILEYASGKRSFAKGVFVGAVTASDTQFPTPLELSAASSVLDNRFVTPYDKRSKVLQKYLKGIMEMRVPDQLSLQEAASLYEVWNTDRALVTSLHDEVFLSKYTESSGNPREFVWKGLLSTLDT